MGSRRPVISSALFLLLLVLGGSSVAGSASGAEISGLYVANPGADSVTVHRLDARDNAAPLRTIRGPLTRLRTPYDVAVDSSGELYVANGNPSAITVYPPGANGNVAPARVISGPATRLSNPVALAVDNQGQLFVVNNDGNMSSITVYRRRAHGDASPLRVISGSRTGLDSAHDVALDVAGNLYVTDGSTHRGGPYRILVFASRAEGNTPPLRTIGGPRAGLNGVAGVGIDRVGRLYAACSRTSEIRVFAAAADGDAVPVRIIRGRRTGLDAPPREPDPVGPEGVALDTTGALYVSNWGTDSILVFAPGAYGNAAPLRLITGPRTGLAHPMGLVLRP